MKEMRKQIEDEKIDFDEQWSEIEKMISGEEEEKKKVEAFKPSKKVKVIEGPFDPEAGKHDDKKPGGKETTSAIDKEKEEKKKEHPGAENLAALKLEEKNLRKRFADSTTKVKEYQKALANIKKETGLNDIEELVNAFEHAEEDNLSLFNYVTELTNEVIH